MRPVLPATDRMEEQCCCKIARQVRCEIVPDLLDVTKDTVEILAIVLKPEAAE